MRERQGKREEEGKKGERREDQGQGDRKEWRESVEAPWATAGFTLCWTLTSGCHRDL